MSNPVEIQLYNAADNGRASEVSSLLRDHPEIRVNWTNDFGWTPLHIASDNGHVEVVKLLLAHPDIDVNMEDSNARLRFHGVVSLAKCLLFDCC